MYLRKGPVRRGAVAEIGRASVERTGADVTIVATMLMVERSLEAARVLEAEGIDVEVIDLRWIRPLDYETVKSSIEKTGRLVVAEEQWHEAGWGATLISWLAMNGVHMASLPRSVAMLDEMPVPFAAQLEDAVMPSVERIADEVRASLMS
jgi:pyruvate/2-oxoglutarate/acetoin dehydrogenase E1 component